MKIGIDPIIHPNATISITLLGWLLRSLRILWHLCSYLSTNVIFLNRGINDFLFRCFLFFERFLCCPPLLQRQLACFFVFVKNHPGSGRLDRKFFGGLWYCVLLFHDQIDQFSTSLYQICPTLIDILEYFLVGELLSSIEFMDVFEMIIIFSGIFRSKYADMIKKIIQRFLAFRSDVGRPLSLCLFSCLTSFYKTISYRYWLYILSISLTKCYSYVFKLAQISSFKVQLS